MVNYGLPASNIAELRAAHRRTREKCEADRIKAVVWLASGHTADDIADARLIDTNTGCNRNSIVPTRFGDHARAA